VESDLLDFGKWDKGDLATGLLAFVEVVVARDDGGVAPGTTTEARVGVGAKLDWGRV
jgi:hypothetical protein